MRFEDIDAQIRGAVESVAASDPNPTDPFRGLYISDDLARSLAQATPIEELDDRIAGVAELLDLDALESDVLALCAAPELSPRYGRLLAYLHDDVTRKLASPRLVTRLLASEQRPRDAILACFAHDAPLRRAGAIRLLDGDTPGPLADRMIKVPDRLAAQMLGARLDRPPGDGRLRRLDVDIRIADGFHERVDELEALLATDSALPVLVAGPDAPLMLASALGKGLLLLDVGALASPELLADATLAARLEGRQLCFDHPSEIAPGDREGLTRALAARHERPLLCAASREAALYFDGQTVMVVETAMPGYAERAELWRALSGSEEVRDVAAKFRLSATQNLGRLRGGAAERLRQGGAAGAERGSACRRTPGLEHASRRARPPVCPRASPGRTSCSRPGSSTC